MKSAQAVKILYFTAVPLAKADNGGSIVCRYHVQQLAACEGFELHVSTFGNADQESGTREFVGAIVTGYHPIHYRVAPPPSKLVRIWSPAGRWPFLLKSEARAYSDVDWQFRTLVERLKPDIVVIDFLLSALFVSSVFSMPVRIITITLNKEAEFHAQMRRFGKLLPGVSTSIIAQWRLAHFERSVYCNSDTVVVLSQGDLPSDPRVRPRAAILEPILDESPDRWRFCKSQEFFFVGNTAHFPNFFAVKWLAEQFAPALAQRCPNARIRIVEVAADQVPPEWNHDNIKYMGPCDERTLTHLFITSDLFIAPIENKFGAKMKVMQCLTHGTPMLATSGALSGVPFRDLIPQFSLNDAAGAADLAADLLGNEMRLIELSRMLTSEHRLLASRNDAWPRLITKVQARPLRPVSRLPMFSPLRPRKRNDRTVALRPWPKRLEIGVEEPLGLVTSGMYSVEEFDHAPLRWTSEIAELELALNQTTLPTALTLWLWAIAPARGTNFRALVNGLELIHGKVHEKPIKQTIPLPDLTGVPNLRIRLESPGFQSEGDVRRLGVAIRSIVLSR